MPAIAVFMAAFVWAASACSGGGVVVVGATDTVEQEVLGEILAQELEARGVEVERRFGLSGTEAAHAALTAGGIDLYVEYTGAMLAEVLDRPMIQDADSVYTVAEEEYIDRWSLVLGPPLGFESTGAVVVRAAAADSLGLETVSDLAGVEGEWAAGIPVDPAADLVEIPGILFDDARRMEPDELYGALATGEIDVALAGSSTDGRIAALELRALVDDDRRFPPRQAVPVVRRSAIERQPVVWDLLQSLAGRLTVEEMQELNRQAMERGDVDRIVRRWRAVHLGGPPRADGPETEAEESP